MYCVRKLCTQVMLIINSAVALRHPTVIVPLAEHHMVARHQIILLGDEVNKLF